MNNLNDTRKKLPTNARYMVLVLVFINIIINYMDRTNISVAMPEMAKEIGLTTVQQGLIFSAFGWIYAAMQIPGGFLLDKFGSRIVYGIGLMMWSFMTLLHSMISGFSQLIGLRMGVGAFEAPVMPANNRAVSYWFPDNERGTAIGIYSSAQFLGLAFMTPLLFAIHNSVGWRGLFVITGGIGIVWALVWYLLYRDPQKSRRISKEELQYIKEGGAIFENDKSNKDKKEKQKITLNDIKSMFNKRLIGIYIGQFAISATFWFFLTWFPTYLVEARGIDFFKSGLLSSVPYLAAFCGVLLAGKISDKLIAKGMSVSLARKAPVICGLLLTIFILGANFVDSPALIILFMSIAFFGNGLATITWVFVTALSPKHLIGLAGGIFNFCGALSSIVVPIVIGYLASGGNFAPALIFIAALALIGACSYIFVVGKIDIEN